jgi:N-acetylmuramoyl-L-alanine amidase
VRTGTQRRTVIALSLVALLVGCAQTGQGTRSPAVEDGRGIPVTAADEPPEATTEPSGVVVTSTGVTAPVLASFPGGWWVRTPCHAVADVRDGAPVRSADVVVDAGHGGDENGAVAASGLREADVNLAVADELVRRLRATGLVVVPTRTTDHRVTIRTRAEVATALEPTVVISVHHNAGSVRTAPAPGTEVFHQIGSVRSEALAGRLHDEVVAVLTPIPVTWAQGRNPGVNQREGEDGDYYGILRYTAGVPTVITEAGYLDHPPEAAVLADPAV